MSPLRLFTRPEFIAGSLSGLLLALASPPGPLGFLGYIALVPVLVLLFDPRRLRGAEPVRLKTLILSFGLTRHAVQLHWLMFLTDAATFEYRWLLPICLLLLALYLTLWDGIFFWMAKRLRGRYGFQGLWWMPAAWVFVEWIRGAGELGFPWMRLGMSQLDYVPILQIAGVLGELGVSLFVMWVSVLLTVCWFTFHGEFPRLGRAVLNRWWAPSTLLLLFGAAWFFGGATAKRLESPLGEEQGLRVGIIQGDVDLNDKFDPARRDSTFVPYTLLSQAAAADGARLLVWPETAIPMDITRDARYLDRIQNLVTTDGVYLFSGFPERQVAEDGRLIGYNSSLLMDDAGVVRARYRKMHLLPFGERMPFQGVFPFLGELDFGQAEWTPGPERTILDVDGFRFGNLICFESILSKPSREAVREGAAFLVNMSNDGWFGRTLGPYQHGLMAAMRSAENRVPMVRCANNGICFFALPSGRVVDQTRLFERTYIVRTIHPNPEGSPYTRWGELPLALLLVLGCGFLYGTCRKDA